jgi:hypothetical protein
MKYIGKYSSTMLAATIQCCQLVTIESKLYKNIPAQRVLLPSLENWGVIMVLRKWAAIIVCV